MADMNITPSRAGLTPQIWDGKFFAEYVRKNRFARYMGTRITDMIQVKEDLTVKVGDTITFATVRRLVGAGVEGNTVLEGNEEILGQRSMKLTVKPIRHAVAVSDWDEQKSSIDLRDASKDALQTWSMERMRTDLINGFMSVDGIPYATANATARNAWLANNADRVQFGAVVANNAANVHAASLANIDPTADRMTGDLLSLAKRRAQMANPHIRPIQTDDNSDEEWFVVFLHPLLMRDFRKDPAVRDLNKDSLPREGAAWKNNPLFSGSDMVWDGMFVREIPELPVLTGVGAGGTDVAPAFLCGAQALGVAWAQKTKTTTNVRDYGYFHGVGLQEMRGIGKLRFGKDPAVDDAQLVDQGVYTIFASAPSDA